MALGLSDGEALPEAVALMLKDMDGEGDAVAVAFHASSVQLPGENETLALELELGLELPVADIEAEGEEEAVDDGEGDGDGNACCVEYHGPVSTPVSGTRHRWLMPFLPSFARTGQAEPLASAGSHGGKAMPRNHRPGAAVAAIRARRDDALY